MLFFDFVPIFLVLIIPIVIFILRKADAIGELEKKYKTAKNFPEQTYSMQYGRIGSLFAIRGLLKVGINQNGLFLVGTPSLILSKIFIPWNDISQIKNGSFISFAEIHLLSTNTKIYISHKILKENKIAIPERLRPIE